MFVDRAAELVAFGHQVGFNTAVHDCWLLVRERIWSRNKLAGKRCGYTSCIVVCHTRLSDPTYGRRVLCASHNGHKVYETAGGGECWWWIVVAIVTVPFTHVHIVLDLSYILPCLLIWTFVFSLNGVWQLYKSAIDW